MAANQAPTSAVTIVPNGDLTIVLSDADNKTYRFKVDRATMASNSEHFKASLQGRFKEATTNVINLIDDNAVGLQAFLRAIHDRLAGFSGPFDSPIWWHIVMACDKYEIDVRDKSNVVTMRLRKFFGECYKKQGYRPATLNVNLCRQLMYPSFIFDEAHAFHLVTRYLAYNGVGHITEINPTGLYQLHLPNRIISQLNGARGHLRHRLHTELWEIIDSRFDATCKCAAETIKGYQGALRSLNTWPIEKYGTKVSIDVLLDRLSNFNYDPLNGRDRNDVCMGCRGPYKSAVEKACEKISDLFDGLCLDCMDRTKHKTRDEDEDYWKHEEIGRWSRCDVGCRITHGHCTWYSSFMGRKDKENVV